MDILFPSLPRAHTQSLCPAVIKGKKLFITRNKKQHETKVGILSLLYEEIIHFPLQMRKFL